MEKINSKLCWLLLGMLFSIQAWSQTVSVNVQITPPYSPYLSDYFSIANKTLVIVTNFGSRGSLNLKLVGKIEGDNGIVITTGQNAAGATAFVLAPGMSKTLTGNALQRFFDINDLTVSGISKQQLISGSGLPEGNYTMCIRAFDVNDNEFVSEEEPAGCSAPFSIFAVDPPIIISPLCESEVMETPSQTIVFSWTPPTRISPNTKYLLRIAEINPNTRNPNDALLSATSPQFFEKLLTTNSYVYTLADPKLVPGRQYAFIVMAFESKSLIITSRDQLFNAYRNGGQSEVCTFTYQKNPALIVTMLNVPTTPVITPPNIKDIRSQVPQYDPQIPPNLIPGLTDIAPVKFPPFLTMNFFSGKLLYKYREEDAGPPDEFPLKNAQIELRVRYGLINSQTGEIDWEGYHKSAPKPKEGIFSTQEGEVIATAQTSANGSFVFTLPEGMKFGKVSNGFQDFWYDDNGQYHNFEDSQNPGASSFHSGDLYRFVQICVAGEHYKYYLDPKDYIDLGKDLTANKTYYANPRSKKLSVTLKTWDLPTKFMEFLNKPAGMKVYLLRKKNMQDAAIFPLGDGYGENSGDENNEATITINNKEYTKVAESISNPDGVAVFQRVVWQRHDVNNYYIYAEPPEGSQLNYYMLAPYQHNTTKYYQSDNYEKGYTYDNISEEVIVFAAYPKIMGNIRDIDNNQPAKDASAVLLEWFDITSGNTLDRTPDFEHSFVQDYFQQKIIENINEAAEDLFDFWGNNDEPAESKIPAKIPVFLFQQTDASGNFSFKDLFLQVNNSTKEVNGPSRNLYAGAPGYNQWIAEKLNNNTPLRYGQKLEYSIKLDKGAVAFLTVVDGDSGEGLEDVEIYVEGDEMSYLSPSNGFMAMPVKKLPNQVFVFKKEGYITVKITVNVDEKFKNLGEIKLFTMKRRLDVKVVNANDNTTAIPGARVEIKQVSTTCKETIEGKGTGKFKTPDITLSYDCPLSKLTDNYGMASFAFENAEENEYTIVVSGPSGKNWEVEQVSTAIPYSADPTNVVVKLKPATCIKGTVYAGENNSSPVSNAVVKMKQSTYMFIWFPSQQEGSSSSNSVNESVLEATTKNDGTFELHNVPVRSYMQTVEGYKSESNLVGDSKTLLLNTASNTCTNVDLHLKVFNDMDITNLMGFGMAVTKLTSTNNTSATISGYFTNLPAFGNDQFGVVNSPENKLSFVNLEIIADPLLKNDKGIPVSKPKTLPLKTEENDLDVLVYNTQATLKDNKIGVHLDKSTTNQIYGVIKGKILMPATSINASNFSFGEDIYMAQPNKPAEEKMYIPAIYADKSIHKPVTTDKGMLVCNADGQSAKIKLPEVSQGLTADAANTWFLNGNFTIDATFHTNINTLDEPDLNLKIKGMVVNKNTGLQPFNSSQEISAKMNKWDLKSTDWTLDAQGIKLKNFKIHTNGTSGLIVPGTDIIIKYSELYTNLTKVDLAGLTLPGGKPVKVLGGSSGFNNTMVNGKKIWQIYVNGASANSPAAQIENLDGFNSPFKLNSIMLMNDGTQKIIMGENPGKVHNAVDFNPTANTPLVLENSFMMIAGSLELHLAELKKYPAILMYKLNSNNPVIESINMNKISFTEKGLYVEVQNPTLSPGLFQAKGFVKEDNVLNPVNVTLKYTPTSVDLPIDPGQKIPIQGNDKYFDDVKGEMHLDLGTHKWTTFWFDGIMKGMPGISDVNDKVTNQPQRMKMFCNGAITADAQSISVKNVETPFGTMSWTYDMPGASLHGSCILNAFDIGGMKLDGTVETEVGSSGWYFIAGGSVQIPTLGGGNLLAFFGNYDGIPKLSGNPAGLGTYKCLPPDFQSQVKGVLISAGITKNIVDPTSYKLPVIGIGFEAHVTAGLTGRFYTSFNGSSGTNYNIGLMANVSAGGNIDIGCIKVGGNATLEASISGNYNTQTKDFSITGCTSLDIGLKGELCLTPVDVCLGLADCCAGCMDPLEALGINQLTMGAHANANSSGDWDLSFDWESCSNSACK